MKFVRVEKEKHPGNSKREDEGGECKNKESCESNMDKEKKTPRD